MIVSVQSYKLIALFLPAPTPGPKASSSPSYLLIKILFAGTAEIWLLTQRNDGHTQSHFTCFIHPILCCFLPSHAPTPLFLSFHFTPSVVSCHHPLYLTLSLSLPYLLSPANGAFENLKEAAVKSQILCCRCCQKRNFY